MPKSKGLMERIKDGETVIVAEGYIFAFEHLGYLKAGPFTPEVVGSGLIPSCTVRCVPAVITFGTHFSKYSKDGKVLTADDVEFNDALRRLVAAGADVVGFNCMSGPTSMLPLLESASKADIGVPIAALPVPYRTTMEEPNFTTIKDPVSGQRAFYTDLDCLLCSRTDIVKFAERCAQLKIPYVGLCCGNSPHYTRTLAETLGRVTEASKYSPDMSLHGFYGTNAGKVNTYYTKMTQDLPATKAMTAKE
eukprot:XP_011683383.1 PREDICTED: betaine--homocysteine S-methyltransferase 1-like [Strongylocentrotus purpuratus]